MARLKVNRSLCFLFILGSALTLIHGAAATAPGGDLGQPEPPVPLFSAPDLEVGPSLLMYETGSDALDAHPELATFFGSFTDQWEIRWDQRNNCLHLAQGVGIPLIPGAGNSLSMEDLGLPDDSPISLDLVESLLRAFIARFPELFPLEYKFEVDSARSMQISEPEQLWNVEFRQLVDDVPVHEDAHLFFRINNGNIVQFGLNRVAPVLVNTTPTLDEVTAAGLLLDLLSLEPISISDSFDPSLKIYSVLTDGEVPGEVYLGPPGLGYNHVLVWEFVFSIVGDMRSYQALLDAHTGQLLKFVDLNYYYASVKGGIYPRTNSDTEQAGTRFPFAWVIDNGVTKTTDANGNYTFSGPTATVNLNGAYINPLDDCGSHSISTGSPGNIDFGASLGTDCSTPGFGGAGNTHATRNAFYHLSVINRKARSFFPNGHPWLDCTIANVTPPKAKTNFTGLTCQGSWNWAGYYLSFSRAGIQSPYPGCGGSTIYCSNVGEIASILIHEWGHGLDQYTGGRSDDGGSAEAAADTIAFLQMRDSCIGPNYFPNVYCHNCGACTGVRHLAPFALNGGRPIASAATVRNDAGIDCDACPFQYCQQSYRGPMGFEGHCESLIASTANWDLAQMLLVAHGEIGGWAKMEEIWYKSMPGQRSAYGIQSGGTCNQNAVLNGCAAGNWYTLLLAADDDDGNIYNGTPNSCRIYDAYAAHGIACSPRYDCSSGTTRIFESIATEDGRILENGDTNQGGTVNNLDANNRALRVGDDNQNRQYKSILSFDTSEIPEGVTITTARLELTRGWVQGTNPFTTHGNCKVDIRTGAFGGSNALVASDFQASSTRDNIAQMSNPPSDGSISSGVINLPGRQLINTAGRTQFRVRMRDDDNGDGGEDYMGFYSGDHGDSRPRLIVTY